MSSDTRRMTTESMSSTGSMSLSDLGDGARESQVKFCHDRVAMVQKHYGQFCDTLGSITRKIAHMRDKGDILAKQLKEYADTDKISHSTTMHLKQFSENLSAVQDYRQAEIKRLEKKVVEPLSKYGDQCKIMKKTINNEKNAISKQVKQKSKLEKARSKRPGDAHYLSQVETELQKATSDANIGSEALNTQIQNFEKEKVADLKHALVDFVSVEMMFHAKALEYYSRCFENAAMIDEEMDMEEFARRLACSSGPRFTATADPSMGTLGTMGTASGSGMTSTLGSTSDYTSTGSYTYTYGSTGTGLGSTGSTSRGKKVRIQTQSMYADDDDDEDEDEDEDDDDEGDNGRR